MLKPCSGSFAVICATVSSLRGPEPANVSDLTSPADVFNLQVFSRGRTGVGKETVRRQHATLGLILAPI